MAVEDGGMKSERGILIDTRKEGAVKSFRMVLTGRTREAAAAGLIKQRGPMDLVSEGLATGFMQSAAGNRRK